jgi:hypothetical protein
MPRPFQAEVFVADDGPSVGAAHEWHYLYWDFRNRDIQKHKEPSASG